MEKLLKELENELSRMEMLRSLAELGVLEGPANDLKRIMDLKYINGKVYGLELAIQLVKQLKQK